MAVADPDLQIMGGGELVIQTLRKEGGRIQKEYFSALWASVWSKNKGNPPLDPPLRVYWKLKDVNGLDRTRLDIALANT